ncbi:MAG: 3-hydroxybutyryl-CoA dehydrogenase [Chloroflexi bacterium]|nr:3-hydroxybutyryl-CoA dehydrogenase [Chloroflexota bacterium]
MEANKVFVVSSIQTIEVASAISQVAACAGCSVVIKCDDQASCEKAISEAKKLLDGRVATDELTAGQVEAAIGRIQTTIELGDAKHADIIIETVFEDEGLKRKTLSALDEICASDVILATNTSTITVTSLANATNRPEQVIGMHFIYFSTVMKVMEIVRGVQTSDATFNAVEALAAKFKMEVSISEDVPGLLSTRIWMVHLNEASNNVFNKLVEPEALRKLNRTISPNALSILESADFIGLDNCVALLQNLNSAYNDPKYSPSPLLTRMVDAGQLGVRTGGGFFKYI